jgi:hypothetical protein
VLYQCLYRNSTTKHCVLDIQYVEFSSIFRKWANSLLRNISLLLHISTMRPFINCWVHCRRNIFFKKVGYLHHILLCLWWLSSKWRNNAIKISTPQAKQWKRIERHTKKTFSETWSDRRHLNQRVWIMYKDVWQLLLSVFTQFWRLVWSMHELAAIVFVIPFWSILLDPD